MEISTPESIVNDLAAVRGQLIDLRESKVPDDMSFGELIYRATKFDNYWRVGEVTDSDFHENCETFLREIVLLEEKVKEGNADAIGEQIGVSLLLAIRILVWNFGIVSPHDLLYAKYLANVDKYLILMAGMEDMANLKVQVAPEIWKEFRKANKSNDIHMEKKNEYRHILDLIDSNSRPTFPFNRATLKAFHLVQQEFLIRMGRDFSLEELCFEGMVEELKEFGEARVLLESDLREDSPWKLFCAFEVADVMIYLTHMLTVMGLDISSVIKSVSDQKYIETLGLDVRTARWNQFLRRKRWSKWFAYTKLQWLSEFD